MPFICIPRTLISEVKSLSHVRLFATPWTVACQAPPTMGFSRQEYWSGLLFPFPGNFPDPGIGPESPELQASALPSEPPGKPRSVKKRVVKEDEKKKRHVGSSRAESQ